MTETPTTPSGGRSLPRFITSLHGRGGDEFVRPIPPVLLRRLAQAAEGMRHADLGERYSVLRTRVTALGGALQKAMAADELAERKAIEKGTKSPKPKAPVVEDELEDARRQLAKVEELLAESAADLLRAAIPYLSKARTEAKAAAERALDEVADALRLAEERFAVAGELAAESSWLAELDIEGRVHVWRGGKSAQPAPNALGSLRKAVAELGYDRAAAAKRQEKAAREREVAAGERLPPGSIIWRGGETITIGEKGEEVER